MYIIKVFAKTKYKRKDISCYYNDKDESAKEIWQILYIHIYPPGKNFHLKQEIKYMFEMHVLITDYKTSGKFSSFNNKFILY